METIASLGIGHCLGCGLIGRLYQRTPVVKLASHMMIAI